MSESVILCEGFHDRAFWDGWLTFLGCNSDGFKPGTPGYPALDPWGDPVRRGQLLIARKAAASSGFALATARTTSFKRRAFGLPSAPPIGCCAWSSTWT